MPENITGYRIQAPSGARISITKDALWRYFAAALPVKLQGDRSDLALIQMLPASRIDKLGLVDKMGKAMTVEDINTWNRERRHPVPLQSFRFVPINEIQAPEAKRPGLFLTPKEAEEVISILKDVRKGVNEQFFASFKSGHKERMTQADARLRAVVHTLEHELAEGDQAPRPGGLNLPPALAKAFATLVKRALFKASYGGNVTQDLQELLQILQYERGIATVAPKDGWGHTTENASTDDLLREHAAAEAGTDKHEKVFKEVLGKDDEKLALAAVWGELQNLRSDISQSRQAEAAFRERFTKQDAWMKEELNHHKRTISRIMEQDVDQDVHLAQEHACIKDAIESVRRDIELVGNATKFNREKMAELEHRLSLLTDTKPSTSTMIPCPLPEHDDQNRSCSLDLTTLEWVCYGCSHRGNLRTQEVHSLKDAPPAFMQLCPSETFDAQVANATASCVGEERGQPDEESDL